MSGDKFGYEVLEYSVRLCSWKRVTTGDVYPDSLVKVLNTLGDEGFEVIAEADELKKIVLKRRKS